MKLEMPEPTRGPLDYGEIRVEENDGSRYVVGHGYRIPIFNKDEEKFYKLELTKLFS